ncbi:MAG TPA: Mur ligase family protein, partial [Ferruginibacter sp.]|nr:Mur ligase family protein [Ferruginibacter sp.]
MTHIHFTDLIQVLGIPPLQQTGNVVVDTILTDSRRLLLGEGSLFVAISSAHKNANDFVLPLYQRGVKAFILDREPTLALLSEMPDASIIQVPDALTALQQLAAWKRHLYAYPVIGITGSNGKTIVKEWLYQLLNDRYHIVRSPKSYNSQVGVPLSVWAMQPHHTLGIFEAGISQKGEMNRLQPMIDPNIGVLTFMGEAHAEGFRSMEEKIREKLQLFRTAHYLIYASDDPRVEQVVQHFRHTVNPSLQLFSWGHQPTASLQVLHQEQKDDTSIIHLRYQADTLSLVIPFTDAASVFNVLTCCAVLLQMGQSLVSIARQLHELRPVEMRLELKQGTNQCSVINDSYSADLNSLMIALDFL